MLCSQPIRTSPPTPSASPPPLASAVGAEAKACPTRAMGQWLVGGADRGMGVDSSSCSSCMDSGINGVRLACLDLGSGLQLRNAGVKMGADPWSSLLASCTP